MNKTYIHNGHTITVECKRIVCNPCAPDEYEVILKQDDKIRLIVMTLTGLFETDDMVCERIYHQWLNKQNK